MEFIRLHSWEDGRAQEIFASYEITFPQDERRNKTQFQALFKNPKVKVFSIVDQKENVGYLVTWLIEDFYYIEHFEVFESFRNRKLGSSVLTSFAGLHPHLILESEPANLNEIAKRRIDFYQRNGFEIIDKNYTQPPYEAGKNPLNLWLLTNVAVEDAEKIAAEIHKIVYLAH